MHCNVLFTLHLGHHMCSRTLFLPFSTCLPFSWIRSPATIIMWRIGNQCWYWYQRLFIWLQFGSLRSSHRIAWTISFPSWGYVMMIVMHQLPLTFLQNDEEVVTLGASALCLVEMLVTLPSVMSHAFGDIFSFFSRLADFVLKCELTLCAYDFKVIYLYTNFIILQVKKTKMTPTFCI